MKLNHKNLKEKENINIGSTFDDRDNLAASAITSIFIEPLLDPDPEAI